MDKSFSVNTQQKKNQKKSKPSKIFHAQVNCQCKKKCAEIIDVINQKDIFDQFYGYSTWSERTNFLRSIVNQNSVKENLNPRINLRSKDFFSTYFFSDATGGKQRVCSTFVTKLLQINRSILFRANSSIKRNPYAIDCRGKAPKKKTAAADTAFVKQFVQSFPCYE